MTPVDPERSFHDLDAALREPERVEDLRLGVDDRAALPDTLARLHHLRVLRLALPRLHRLPEALASLPSLTHVAIELTGDLDLDHAFTLLGALPSLTSLGVFSLPARLPASIARLTRLDTLTLAVGRLEHLPPELGALTGLTRLDLTDLPLASLPDELGALTRLRLLRISGGMTSGHPATFDRLPESLGRLHDLEELFLWHLPLGALPDAFGDLRALRRLTVGFARLAGLPASFDRLASLEELALRGVDVDVPALLGRLAPLPRLRRLALEYLRDVTLDGGVAALPALTELLVPHAMRVTIAGDFAPPPSLALLSLPNWNLTAADRARLDAAFPRKLWSGRNEQRERVYRRKPTKPARPAKVP